MTPGVRTAVRALARRVLPDRHQAFLRSHALHLRPPLGRVRFGSLGRLEPISRSFGFDRGTPVDRFYIARFLGAQTARSNDVQGRVLEVGDDSYTRRFAAGEGESIQTVDVLDIDETNPRATIIADLAWAPEIPSNRYDCIICTQTLLLIFDVGAAVAELHRILSPGGILLVTVPGISKICRPEMERFGDYWRFTSASVRRLLEQSFPPAGVTVKTYGNVLTAIAFLHGVAAEELSSRALERWDPDFEVLIAARAVKAGQGGAT